MPHSLTVASLILRLCAGFIAALSFYMAFFMYEDEKGAWQNRLEDLWASVYDRAKVTDGTTTALFNRLADAMKILFKNAFGRRLLSLKAVFVSANLTLGLGLIASMVLWKFVQPSLYLWEVRSTAAHDGLRYVTYDTIYDISQSWGRMLEQIVGRAYFRSTLVAIIFLLCAFLSSKSRTTRNLCWLSGPVVLFVAMSLHKNPQPSFLKIGEKYLYAYVPLILLLSVCWDFVSILAIRRLFAASVEVVRLRRVLLLLLQFTSLALTSTVLPVALSWALEIWFPRFRVLGIYVDDLTNLLTLFNLTTLFYCLVPLVCLVVVLAHRLTWPVLGRLLYPIAAEKVIGNRKVLVSVGSTSISYAVAGGHISLESLLKLLR